MDIKEIKILWFCNTPCCAIEKLTKQANTGGGWLNTLSNELAKHDNIELHIAFYWNNKIDSFIYKNIHYHPIYLAENKSKINRLIKRFKITFLKLNNHDNYLINIVHEINPNIIHIHGTEENFGIITKKIFNVPIVISIQGFLSSIYTKLFSGYTRNQVYNNESLFSKININGAKYAERSLAKRAEREREILKHTKYIIGRTDFDRNCSLIINPQRQYFKVGEIMRNEFFNIKWDKDSFSEIFEITTTISNGIYKGLEVIYYSAKLLSEKQFKFKWNIIGLNSNSEIVKLTEKITKINSEANNIHYLGRQDATNISQLLVKSDLYCQTSHIENSSNSTCEAMSIGLPIIASFVGGTSSLIENNITGVLVQDGDPYSLAGAILNIANSFNLAKKLGQNARTFAKNNFSPEKVSEEIINTYHSILI